MLARGLTAAKRKRAELELRQAEGELIPVQLHARALKVIVATLVANLGNIEADGAVVGWGPTSGVA